MSGCGHTADEHAAFIRELLLQKQPEVAAAIEYAVAATSPPVLPVGWRAWRSPEGVTHAVPPTGPCATCGRGRHDAEKVALCLRQEACRK